MPLHQFSPHSGKENELKRVIKFAENWVMKCKKISVKAASPARIDSTCEVTVACTFFYPYFLNFFLISGLIKAAEEYPVDLSEYITPLKVISYSVESKVLPQ